MSLLQLCFSSLLHPPQSFRNLQQNDFFLQNKHPNQCLPLKRDSDFQPTSPAAITTLLKFRIFNMTEILIRTASASQQHLHKGRSVSSAPLGRRTQPSNLGSPALIPKSCQHTLIPTSSRLLNPNHHAECQKEPWKHHEKIKKQQRCPASS